MTHVTICIRKGDTRVTFLLDHSRPDHPMVSINAPRASVGKTTQYLDRKAWMIWMVAEREKRTMKVIHQAGVGV